MQPTMQKPSRQQTGLNEESAAGDWCKSLDVN